MTEYELILTCSKIIHSSCLTGVLHNGMSRSVVMFTIPNRAKLNPSYKFYGFYCLHL